VGRSSEERKRRLNLWPLFRGIAAVARALVAPPARALRGSARRFADPARQVLDYWISERVTMRQGMAAVSVASLTALIGGMTLAFMEDRLVEVAGLLVLVPASIDMRGNIFGALSARLGTSIHSGLFEVTAARGGLLYQNAYAATLLTITTAVTMGILAWSIAGLFGIPTITPWAFIAIGLIGGILSSAIVLAVTVALSIVSYRRRWDLDSVGAPLITALGDVVTLPMLLLASFIVELPAVTTVIGVVGAVAAIGALYVGWTTGMKLTRRVTQESFPILSLAVLLSVLAGTVVEPRVETVFAAFPALLIVLPGFLANTGALGSVLASRLGSKLHLGAVTPRPRPEAAAVLDSTIIIALGFTVYTLLAFTTLGAATLMGAEHPGLGTFVGAIIVGGILATLVAAFIGYYAAIATFRLGLDPDNHTVPLVTSGMDLLGAVCLISALVAFGVP
jgi:mgtE-like transporter